MTSFTIRLFDEDSTLVEFICASEITSQEKDVLCHYLRYKTNTKDIPRVVIPVSIGVIKRDIIKYEGELDFLSKVIGLKVL